LETTSRRVLVVEDYEPFRRFICSMLSEKPGFEVFEVADGLEAVRKAEELQPDLIVLDIGLPLLNGIDAARRILKMFPESKILFLSQESSAEVVQEALALGALGYVVKVHMGTELLPAVDAVLQGRQFVSRGLSGHGFTLSRDSKAVERAGEPLPLPATERLKVTHSHKAEFYSDEATLVAGFARFIEAALVAGSAVITVATEAHRAGILQCLRDHGVDMVAAVEQRRYVSLDVTEAFSAVMVNDLPDPVRFQKVVGDLISAAAEATNGKRCRVALCGECSPLLWVQGKAEAAVELEHLCEQIARTRDVDILCGYLVSSFQRAQQRDTYDRICAEHSAISFV
jgi:DNA-binding response OmpR family regulator